MAHQGRFDELQPDWRPERALVVRKEGSVQVRAIGDREFELLSQLRQGRSLGDSLNCAAARHPAADIAKSLSTIISTGALTLAAAAEED